MKLLTSASLVSLALLLLQSSRCDAQSGWFWQNPLPQGNDLHDVTFAAHNIGTAVGRAGTIIRTVDGGAHWTVQYSGTTLKLTAVSFSDTLTGTVVGEAGIILRTTDGGVTWSKQVSRTQEHLNDVSFTDANTGTAVGWHGTILRTTTGGATWQVKQ
jgi:photosystem II stability/assembly factor-like uncharacterized protein